MEVQKVIFGAGCFWGVQDAFEQISGVISTRVGYAGGNTKQPTYEEVCTGKTGHIEVTEVLYDPKKVSFEELLNAFWKMHDPTQGDKQGPDVGTQYRSVIFYYTEKQKDLAQVLKELLDTSGKLGAPITTEIRPAPEFYEAEEYHQHYFKKHGGGACHL